MSFIEFVSFVVRSDPAMNHVSSHQTLFDPVYHYLLELIIMSILFNIISACFVIAPDDRYYR